MTTVLGFIPHPLNDYRMKEISQTKNITIDEKILKKIKELLYENFKYLFACKSMEDVDNYLNTWIKTEEVINKTLFIIKKYQNTYTHIKDQNWVFLQSLYVGGQHILHYFIDMILIISRIHRKSINNLDIKLIYSQF